MRLTSDQLEAFTECVEAIHTWRRVQARCGDAEPRRKAVIAVARRLRDCGGVRALSRFEREELKQAGAIGFLNPPRKRKHLA